MIARARFLAFVLLALAAMPRTPPASATTYHVPAGVATVPLALGQAIPGDTVLVAPGLYDCSASMPSGVALIGDGPDSSVYLDAGNAGPVLQLTDASSGTLLQNLVLKNGIGTLANGLRVGGGVYGLRSSPVLARVRILACNAAFGGGAYFELGSPSLQGCLLQYNESTYGGGLALNSCTARLDTCWLRSNAASQSGGGLFAINGSVVSVYLCEFSSNSAGANGGGALVAGASMTLLSSSLTANTAAGDGGGLYGGAAASLNCSYNLFYKNQADRGGGLFLGCGAAEAGASLLRGPARRATDCSGAQVINNSILYNGATTAGGGLATSDATSVRMLNCIVALSTAGSGVACLDLRSVLDYRCNDVWRNFPADWQSGCSSPDHPELHNLSVNPLFCDPGAGQFALCDNTSLTDLPDCFTTLVGAFDPNCPACATAVRTLSWGRLRRLYVEPSARPAGSSSR